MKVKDIVEQLNDPTILEDDFEIEVNRLWFKNFKIVSDDGLTTIVIQDDKLCYI